MSLQYYSAFFYLQTKKVHKKKIFTMTLKVNMKLWGFNNDWWRTAGGTGLLSAEKLKDSKI